MSGAILVLAGLAVASAGFVLLLVVVLVEKGPDRD